MTKFFRYDTGRLIQHVDLTGTHATKLFDFVTALAFKKVKMTVASRPVGLVEYLSTVFGCDAKVRVCLCVLTYVCVCLCEGRDPGATRWTAASRNPFFTTKSQEVLAKWEADPPGTGKVEDLRETIIPVATWHKKAQADMTKFVEAVLTEVRWGVCHL